VLHLSELRLRLEQVPLGLADDALVLLLGLAQPLLRALDLRGRDRLGDGESALAQALHGRACTIAAELRVRDLALDLLARASEVGRLVQVFGGGRRVNVRALGECVLDLGLGAFEISLGALEGGDDLLQLALVSRAPHGVSRDGACWPSIAAYAA